MSHYSFSDDSYFVTLSDNGPVVLGAKSHLRQNYLRLMERHRLEHFFSAGKNLQGPTSVVWPTMLYTAACGADRLILVSFRLLLVLILIIVLVIHC
jgi:hypothetical protein